ncbi:MAG: tRNA (adenosine(37)-N6)-threonylcarbamoyltransferase complex dimerization subunit type 1 TsaB [Candidatus Nealsonbacteria bacterium CG23_combo_of_CG06-09_8_20_14_all_40_13]|uniref:tRNA (Adenosine(37)-N6)-threonylcarbamoyltransferase complex dimerization subunit type 1 TsaB n=1 Tax=Candidatus Nealsonbacteria bacterium CG23_combo_of_CG06-09_8_20_14_all_40_13 TaxID=1974724 RepID=A0A2G9YRG6_9BACT|nr:MAG: tRNA (adenosine(37)-N6)-threonylcarbamoyltransferase complex dimerization subunit type 1 TsaB [Candidatus Nealsonbacteria bacterium CG23_combo_of_CG06-09_8_20_14_all_40_13]PIR71218.1 MAG: tRNA (adenosine(37)-N6)-threonylcarbamoyltransferase complex dimerization subunit type 1 TsaB [Candidatus Nealsonbacteria bacterium CG10_big_fil_rev_8_21_14_0_10_40_24]PIU43166.1 MAG: tRNA (adenosine(37)-N6)-threonylcarbamoyltransferase complex dimerization subunit type 1 TsaB [Candidatus Nealsonbacteria
MILSIDTSTFKTGIGLYWQNGRQLSKEYYWESQKNQSQELLINIDKFLKENKVNLQNLKAIGVMLGPGSYTGLRVGLTVANTLGWALGIPVLGLFKEDNRLISKQGQGRAPHEVSTLEIAQRAFAKYKTLKNPKFSQIALPCYAQNCK